MISYSQNQEDVVLFRLDSLVKNGTFIDVGAGHPVLENVTYALYLEGWRGVNIEPMSREVELLREVRPMDETIQAAVGLASGKIKLFEAPIENRGATTFDIATVERYRALGQDFREFESDVITLNSVLSNFSAGSVHILKIDVEGLEKDVLLGADLAQHQPWVLSIEATKPNSQEDSSFEWESIVLSAGYTMVLFDGLNRFYVRNDLSAIQHLLQAPANVFDGWSSASESEAVKYAKSLASVLEQRDIEVANAVEYATSNRDSFIRAQEHASAIQKQLDETRNQLTEANTYIAALLESIERIKA